jgi:hypothetical protein
MKYIVLFLFSLSAIESHAAGYELWQNSVSGRWNYKCTGGSRGSDKEFDFTQNHYARENAEKFCLGRGFNRGPSNLKNNNLGKKQN